jgi:hypothetical protein
MGRKNAQNSNNSPELEQVATRTIDSIERSRTFEPWDKPQIGIRFFIFKQKGDFIQGILGRPITNFQRNTSYPIEQENGEVVEIFANRLLHRIFQKHELTGTCVRVVYIGRQYVFYGGHARKIYRVYKVKGTITQRQELVSDSKTLKPKNKKRRKHGKTNN